MERYHCHLEYFRALRRILNFLSFIFITVLSVLQALIFGSSATVLSSGSSLPFTVNTSIVPEVPLLPGNTLEDGYDDVTEAPGPKDASFPGKNEQEIIGVLDKSDGNRYSWTGESRRAVLLIFIIYSYFTELRGNQCGAYCKRSSRFI